MKNTRSENLQNENNIIKNDKMVKNDKEHQEFIIIKVIDIIIYIINNNI